MSRSDRVWSMSQTDESSLWSMEFAGHLAPGVMYDPPEELRARTNKSMLGTHALNLGRELARSCRAVEMAHGRTGSRKVILLQAAVVTMFSLQQIQASSFTLFICSDTGCLYWLWIILMHNGAWSIKQQKQKYAEYANNIKADIFSVDLTGSQYPAESQKQPFTTIHLTVLHVN